MDLTKGKITSSMIRFTIPIIILQLLNQAYSLIDQIIVARFVNEEALSVLSTVNSTLLVAYCLIQGFGASCNILIGNLFGAKNYPKLRHYLHSLLILCLGFSTLLCIIYSLFHQPMFALLRVPNDIRNESGELMLIYALSLPPTLICSVCTSCLNGLGDSKTPMRISMFAQCLNIILDILAMAVWNLGVKGAAYASLFSVMIAVLLTWHHLQKTVTSYCLDKPHFTVECIPWYLSVAIPSVLQQSIMSIGSLMLQVLVNEQGTSYINGYTVANTIHSLFLLPIISCCAGYETFAAQNYGAGNHKRVRQGYQSLMCFGNVTWILLAIATLCFSNPLIHLFLQDKGSLSYGFAHNYLLLLIPNYALLLIKYSIDSLYKARLKIYLFTISSFIALFVRILAGYLLAPTFGLIALAYATAIGNGAAVLFNLLGLYHISKDGKSDIS